MKIKLCNPAIARYRVSANPRGFSLIEAMVAIVVLVVGILSLTLLQMAMVRSGAGARDRSVAVTVGQNVLELQRANALVSTTSYAALAPQGTFAGGTCDFANTLAAPGTAGLPVEYKYCVRVGRLRASGATFSNAAISGSGAPIYDAITAEYKTVFVDIGWRGADGAWSNVALGDIISGIPLVNSTDLLTRPVGGNGGVGGPQVKYDLTTLTSNTNFIPIAVGDSVNTQLAATNPTPKVIGGGVAETSFQVYTYFADSTLANVQRQLDTRVIGCKCTSRAVTDPDLAGLATEGFSLRPLRPAYWEGARYSAPMQGKYWPAGTTSVLLGAPKTGVSQSEYCDVC
ncbi:MAG: prepilin-type N-terminal cleavage/methylation domain-containing protein, partial [Steroidobacteraceae bacterium]